MGNTSYAVTITSDHQLIVNDTPVAPPEGIHQGDSEALLAWALDRVSDAHAENGGVMTLTTRDHRQDGYGTFETVMQEGEDITIEDLRRRTGKDLSAISTPFDEYDDARAEAEVLAEQGVSVTSQDSDAPEDESAQREGHPDDSTEPVQPDDEDTAEVVVPEESPAESSTDADAGDNPEADDPEIEPALTDHPAPEHGGDGVPEESEEVAPRRAIAEDDEATVLVEAEPDAATEQQAVSAQINQVQETVEGGLPETEVIDADAQPEGSLAEGVSEPDSADATAIETPDLPGRRVEADAEMEPDDAIEAQDTDDPDDDPSPQGEEPVDGGAQVVVADVEVGDDASDDTEDPSPVSDDEVVRGPLPFKPLDSTSDADPTEEPTKEPPLFAKTEEERAAEERAEEEARQAAAAAEVQEAEHRAAEEAERKAAERERFEAEAEAERRATETKIAAVAREHADDADPEADKEIAKKAGLVGRLRGRGGRGPKRQPRNKAAAATRRGKKPRPERISPRQARENATREAHAEQGQEMAGERGWVPLQRQVPRPQVPEAVVRQRRSRPWVWLLVFLVLAGVLGYRYYVANEAEVFAAVCIDERTMTRQATDDACKDPASPPYNRWLYVARDGTVPPVGGVADLDKGASLDPPSNEATLTYGFADEGGLVGAGSR